MGAQRPALPQGLGTPVLAPVLFRSGAVAEKEDIRVREMSRSYEGIARKLASQGRDFSHIFEELCRYATRPGGRLASDPGDEARAMFLGLMAWANPESPDRGLPTFQERNDLALHFIYGGYYGARYGSWIAERIALAKENRDAYTEGNYFDVDDFAASLYGIRWSSRLRVDGATHWVETWAAGNRALSGLPALVFGRLPPKRLLVPARLRRVRDFATEAMK